LDDRGEDRGSTPRAFFRAARFASLGLEMGVAVAIGAAVGYFLDRWLGTKPWLLLVFLLFGIAAGFKGVIDAARKASAEMQASNPRDEEGTRDGSERARKN
jgi:ATP synthase protein I